MNDSEYNELRAASWRRKLSPEEELQAQEYWAAHPEAQADWEEDVALTRQLHDLPDAPLSSNFTSLVLRAIDAEERVSQNESRPALSPRWQDWLRRFAPRMALGVLVAGIGAAILVRQQNQDRQHVAEDVKHFVDVAAL